MATTREEIINKVEKFYDEKAQYEWDRLKRHRTEFAVTMRVLRDYLPEPPATILDIGAGPGRYAIALALEGYAVTLVDISTNCLEFAEAKAREAGVALAGYVNADATDLGQFRSQSYDAVLLMGPLYHLLTADDRRKALGEAKRVLKTAGFLFASFITRYAPFRYVAKHEPDLILKQRQRMKRLFDAGIHKARVRDGGFTDAYFAQPSEIKPLMEEAGFETLDLVACEGIISMIEEKVNELTGEAWDAWVDLNYRLGKDPSVHGSAEHLLYVGRKI